MIRDTNDFAESMGEILDLSRRYYVVAFQPEAFTKPGSFHELEIRVDREEASRLPPQRIHGARSQKQTNPGLINSKRRRSSQRT